MHHEIPQTHVKDATKAAHKHQCVQHHLSKI